MCVCVCVCVYVCVCVCVCVCVIGSCVSLMHSNSLSLESGALPLHLSCRFCVFLSVCLSVCLFLSLSLPLSLSLSLPPFLPTPSFSPPSLASLSLSLTPPPPSLSLCLHNFVKAFLVALLQEHACVCTDSHTFTLSQSHTVSHSPPLSLFLLPPPLSLSHSPHTPLACTLHGYILLL